MIAGADFKGSFAIERVLRKRLMNDSDSAPGFRFSSYLPSPDLGNLLGFYEAGGLNPGFRNGVPNGINMLLWQFAFHKLSKEFASRISNDLTSSLPSVAPLNSRYLELLKSFQNWPSPRLGDLDLAGILEEMWLTCVDYDAPENEMQEWKKAVAATFIGQSSYDAVYGMHMLMFMNPYFLLNV